MVSKQTWMCFSLLLFLLLSLQTKCSKECLEQERFALLQLQPFFDYINWVELERNSNCYQWKWVQCNQTTGRVISIDLLGTKNEDSGEWYLNASLFSPFKELQTLNLGYNQIAGCVENEGFDKLSTLKNLEELLLSSNNFNNSILSSISTISSLKTLDLSYNKGIVNLQDLRLSNLEELDLVGNNLNNNILSSLTGLPSLKQVYLQDTGLKGTIDLSDLRLSNLKIMDLSGNNLNGTVDLSELFDSLNNLERLDMSNNQINKIMIRKGLRLSNLEIMDLSGNNLNNSILSSLTGLSSLRALYLNDNGLKGTIDLSELFDSLNNLEELGMSNNQINKIVVRKGKSAGVSNLTYLGLRNVSIHDGSALLQSLGSFPSLNTLDLRYNNLSGMMSTGDLSNLKNLKLLNMDGSNLDTSILQSIGMLTSLEVLLLQNCSLKGTIPDQAALTLLHQILLQPTPPPLKSQSQNSHLSFLHSPYSIAACCTPPTALHRSPLHASRSTLSSRTGEAIAKSRTVFTMEEKSWYNQVGVAI